MLNVEFSKKSWHYRLMATMSIDARFSDDGCVYVRGVLIAMLITALIVLFAVVAIAWVGDFLGWLLAGLLYSFVGPGLGALITIFSASYFAAMWCILRYRDYMLNRHVHMQEQGIPCVPEKPSFGHAWNTVYEKICFRVKIVD